MPPKLEVYVCTGCTEDKLFRKLERAARDRTNVTVEDIACLGGCAYGSRIDVYLPDGTTKQYAEIDVTDPRDLAVGELPTYAIGDNPVKTVIDDNLPKK